MKFFVAFFFATLCFTAVKCRGRNQPRILFPEPLSEALHNFTFDFYSKIAPTQFADENLVFSPISLYNVLSLLVPGLDGNSLSQVENALRMTSLSDPLEQQSRLSRSVFAESDNYVLSQANRIFIDQHFQLLKSYKEEIVRHVKDGVKKLDFATKPRQSRSKMNRYVARDTRYEITDLIPEDAVDTLSQMFLTNAIYMEAPWDVPFNKHHTAPQRFHVSDSETIQVPTMTSRRGMCQVDTHLGLDATVLVLPFEETALTMVIIMPNQAGDFSALEQADSPDQIRRALELIWVERGYRPRNCHVQMPKFSIDYRVQAVKDRLREMGVADIWTRGAGDFSRMTPMSDQLVADDAQHKATIKVNEDGVRAAAASSIGFGFRMMPATVNVDKPFLFLIRHQATGAVLFVGKVVRPSYDE